MQEDKLVWVFEALNNAFRVLEKYYLSSTKTTTELFMSKTITNSRTCKKNDKNLKTYLYPCIMRTGLSLRLQDMLF